MLLSINPFVKTMQEDATDLQNNEEFYEDKMECSEDATRKDKISIFHRLAGRNLFKLGSLVINTSMDTLIDSMARVLFPLAYTAFIVSYFFIHLL